MREIKFRGWHTKLKRMVPASELVADQMTLLADGRFINVHSSSVKLSEIYPADKFIPLQFTGLLDKNGVEIYEGDIIEFDRREWGGDDNIHLVEWAMGDGAWSWGGGTSHDMEYRTVIGNIYENPELLETK